MLPKDYHPNDLFIIDYVIADNASQDKKKKVLAKKK